MSTGLFMSQSGQSISGGPKFNKHPMIKNSITFSIQKPTKSFIGVSQSKSSSDINSITGNLSSNYASSTAFVNAQNLLGETNNKSSKTYMMPSGNNSNYVNDNKTNFSKIPKSVSTSVIKQTHASNEVFIPLQTSQNKRKLLTILLIFFYTCFCIFVK